MLWLSAPGCWKESRRHTAQNSDVERTSGPYLLPTTLTEAFHRQQELTFSLISGASTGPSLDFWIEGMVFRSNFIFLSTPLLEDFGEAGGLRITSLDLYSGAVETKYEESVMTHLHSSKQRILRLKQVSDRIGLARSTIYDYLNAKSPRHDRTFPTPIKLGAASVGWFEAEIDQWIDTKAAARTNGL